MGSPESVSLTEGVKNISFPKVPLFYIFLEAQTIYTDFQDALKQITRERMGFQSTWGTSLFIVSPSPRIWVLLGIGWEKSVGNLRTGLESQKKAVKWDPTVSLELSFLKLVP